MSVCVCEGEREAMRLSENSPVCERGAEKTWSCGSVDKSQGLSFVPVCVRERRRETKACFS